MKKAIAILGLLALGASPALAQGNGTAAGGGASSQANLPACSAADATRVRNGESPSTPCRATDTGSSAASGSAGSSTSSSGAGSSGASSSGR